jgi:hypothetical protein
MSLEIKNSAFFSSVRVNPSEVTEMEPGAFVALIRDVTNKTGTQKKKRGFSTVSVIFTGTNATLRSTRAANTSANRKIQTLGVHQGDEKVSLYVGEFGIRFMKSGAHRILFLSRVFVRIESHQEKEGLIQQLCGPGILR